MNSEQKKNVLLRLRNISKHFGSVTALDKVSIEIYEDEIVGLVGDNGAGKSTMIKIISGNIAPDEGSLYYKEKEIHLKNPSDARKLGIETVYQDLAICNNLDSVSNLFISREIYKNVLGLSVLNVNEMKNRAKKIFDKVGIHIPSLSEKVEYLSGGQRQAVVLGRFIEWGKKIILLDEPTAALGVRETRKVLDLIKQVKNERRDASIMFISHNLQQIFEIVDRIIVMRHGKIIGVRDTKKTDTDEIVSMITGAIFVDKSTR